MDPHLARFHGLPCLEQVPPAPRRPSADARRIVFAYQGTQAVMRVVGLVFLGVGLALTAALGCAPFEGGEELVVLYDPAAPRCNTLWVP